MAGTTLSSDAGRTAETPRAPTEQFTGLADTYARHRPAYSDEALRWLLAEAGAGTGSHVVDIGAGTGLFSRLLSDLGLRVTAVEPNEDMRTRLEAAFSGRTGIVVRAGTAEETGLPDGCADLVTAAQAFHWFDKPRFRQECARILGPDGYVAVVWNRRLPDDPVFMELCSLYCRHCPAFEAPDRGVNGSEAWYPRFFRDGVFSRRTFPNDLHQDVEGFVGRALSSSFSLQPGDAGYDAYDADLRALHSKYRQDGRVRIANETLCLVGKV